MVKTNLGRYLDRTLGSKAPEGKQIASAICNMPGSEYFVKQELTFDRLPGNSAEQERAIMEAVISYHTERGYRRVYDILGTKVPVLKNGGKMGIGLNVSTTPEADGKPGRIIRLSILELPILQ